MKRLFTILQAAFLFAAVLSFAACSDSADDDDPTMKELLAKSWGLYDNGYVTKDDTDVTEDYDGLTLTFYSDNTYEASNASALFGESGTWEATDQTYSSLTLGDLSVQVLALTEDELVLSFTVSAADNGRVDGVTGNFEIQLFTN